MSAKKAGGYMKKILVYIITLISICFILPAIFTKTTKTITTTEQTETEIQEQPIQGSNTQYSKIKLLHQDTGEVEEVNLEEYLCNVVSAEMPADFELEALKAQATVARTYTIYKVQNKKHDNADICDKSSCCQAWISKEDRLAKWEESKREENWRKIETAVRETVDKIITYDNKPINAFFHSNSGGTTEIPINVWGGTNFPYLQVVETARRRWI